MFIAQVFLGAITRPLEGTEKGSKPGLAARHGRVYRSGAVTIDGFNEEEGDRVVPALWVSLEPASECTLQLGDCHLAARAVLNPVDPEDDGLVGYQFGVRHGAEGIEHPLNETQAFPFRFHHVIVGRHVDLDGFGRRSGNQNKDGDTFEQFPQLAHHAPHFLFYEEMISHEFGKFPILFWHYLGTS